MWLLGKLFGHRKPSGEWKTDNKALLRAIQNVASADSLQNREKLYRLLLDCVLFVPVREVPEELRHGGAAVGRPCNISLQQLRDKQQNAVTPAFTDEEALRNWDPNTPFLGIRAREYFRMVRGTEISAILINPFDPIRKMLRPGGRLARFEFEALAEGILPGRPDASGAMHMTLAEGKTAQIGPPATQLPPNILDALVATGRRAAEIKELYLFDMASESGDGHAVIGIDLTRRLDAAEMQQVLKGLAEAVHPLLLGRKYLDFMVLNNALGDDIRKVGRRLLG
jgi:SseB protein N-terminal domain/SseB protein C-terminal domain